MTIALNNVVAVVTGAAGGIGRELGPWGLAAFQEIKHVVRAV